LATIVRDHDRATFSIASIDLNRIDRFVERPGNCCTLSRSSRAAMSAKRISKPSRCLIFVRLLHPLLDRTGDDVTVVENGRDRLFGIVLIVIEPIRGSTYIRSR